MEISSADRFDSAFKEAVNKGSAGLAVTPTPVVNSNRKLIVELAAKNRLPAIYPDIRWTEAGGLMSYGADLSEPPQARRGFRRQDPQGHKARRYSSRAADEV